ncbi:MAG TPA: hypothetical protein VGU68_07900 [Ktedonobacteraceae bacterium]|nr:hypothetical protein [Ktedonobacteraceae bacterium]
MNSTDLPPLPPPGSTGPEVCSVINLYLGVARDLNPYQARVVAGHLQICPVCARAQRQLGRVTNFIASLEGSEPSARVDQAVMAAIAARSRNQSLSTPQPFMRPATPYRAAPRRRPVRLGGLVAAAAVLIVGLFSVLHFVLPGPTQSAFAVPANVSWDAYVLHHTQTMTDSKGQSYHVESYHNMANDDMNVETTLDGKLDVMVVSDGHQTLGIDMMKHVAQWNADAWSSDDSIFDLTQLRKDLQSGKATYLGKGQFQGKEVYRIRDDTGDVLLLDMQYRPVNVLENTSSSDAGKPMYDKLELLKPTQVPDSMWTMTVPAHVKMGTLPPKP